MLRACQAGVFVQSIGEFSKKRERLSQRDADGQRLVIIISGKSYSAWAKTKKNEGKEDGSMGRLSCPHCCLLPKEQRRDLRFIASSVQPSEPLFGFSFS
jgi:hypothetical protein